MSKSKLLQRKVFKINADRIFESTGSLTLSIKDAKMNGEVISLGESDYIRIIDILGKRKTGFELTETHVGKNEIFLHEYVVVTFDDKKSFYHLAKSGFVLNGKKYIRLLGTNGGVKNNSIVFVSSEVYAKSNEMIINDAKIPDMIPAKLESYRSLVCSSTTPVSTPRNIVIVEDYVTKFNSDITYVDLAVNSIPQIKEINGHELTLEASDGYGVISPRLSKEWRMILEDVEETASGFCIRNSYMKGMVFTFDIKSFAEKTGNKDILVDIWGKEYQVEDIDIIIPKSVFKLWSAYDSIDSYLESCKKNNHNFSVTKMITEDIDNQRTTNYQFLQSLEMDDSEIDKLLRPTIEEYRGILGEDYHKALLFLKGKHMKHSNTNLDMSDFSTALQVEPQLINDPFVRGKIRTMLEKRINDAKKGKIKVDGNFQTISGDVYGFMEHVFGVVNPKGLLKADEFYSSYWVEKGVKNVVGMRAPMTVHANLRKMNVVATDEMKYWYQYMKNIFIFNDWDATCFTLNGADKDGDAVFSTSSEQIWNGTKEMKPIVCSQASAKKVKVTDRLLEKANADGFNGKIGSITNAGSNMIDLFPKFDKESVEYKTLNQRAVYTMKAQQDEIDSIKGAKSYGMPKEWFDYRSNIIQDGDDGEVVKRKELNLRILANKQPYFFIYNYQETKRKYMRYVNLANIKSKVLFRKSIKQLEESIEKTNEQIQFLNSYKKFMPVNMSESLMNKIAWKLEFEFDEDIKESFKDVDFDYSILKTDKKYTPKMKHAISEKHKEYLSSLKKIMLTAKTDDDYDMDEAVKIVAETLKEECIEICKGDFEIATNIIVDLCYKGNTGKQFVWDICAEQIIKNLLAKNGNKITYIKKSDKGDIQFDGDVFIAKRKIIEECENENTQ